MVGSSKNDFYVGLIFSVLGHCMLFYTLLFLAVPRIADLGKPVVYSITLEGGKTLGGIAQVPQTDKQAPLAPPKNVSAEPDQAKVEAEKNKAPEKAEVSIPDKKEPETPKVDEKNQAEKKTKEAEKVKEAPKQPPAADVNRQYQKAMQRYLGESSDGGGKGFGAARLGGSGMGGGVLRPPEFFQYRDLLKNRIKSGWRWYDTTANLTAWVYFELGRDGTITNVSVVQGSGNSEFDESVVRAIYKASPVPPAPENVYQFFEKVRIEFNPSE